MVTKSDIKKQWYMATVLETCAAFEVQMKKGLSPEQVRERSSKAKKSPTQSLPKITFIFWAVLVIMLVLSASVFVLESRNAVLVFTFSSSLLGAFALTQQGFVRHVLTTVAKVPQKQVSVRRDGSVVQISADAVVLGDIFVLSQGDYVPVDVRLLEIKNLLVDERESTGQETPELKNTFTLHKKTKPQNQKNMIAAGSYIYSGNGIGIAVSPVDKAQEQIELTPQKLNRKQQRRHTFGITAVFLLGLTIAFFDIPIFAVIGLSALLALAVHYYAVFWLQNVTWASLYDQAMVSGVRFKGFKQLKSFVKSDFVFVSVPSDFADLAAFIHQLQAELHVEVRPLVKTANVSLLEKELNIEQSGLTYKQFMGASRAKKIQQLHEYQLLVGFDSVATAEAISIMQQAGHHVLWVDDVAVPEPASRIASSYVALNAEPSAFLKDVSDATFVRQGTLKKLAVILDVKTRFKSTTAY
jgi:hypothetical protein